MAGVPQHSISRGFKNAVQCNGKFDSSQVGTKVSTSFGDCTDNELADLFGELIELGKRQRAQISRLVNAGEKRHIYIRLRSESYEGHI
jgi:hypothetical protein